MPDMSLHLLNRHHNELVSLFEQYLTAYRLVIEADHPMSPSERAKWHARCHAYLHSQKESL